MKKIKLLLTLVVITLTTNVSLAQTNHDAKVMGVLDIGQKDYAIILDEITQETYKTAVYNKGLLTIDEGVEVNILTDKKVKIIKPNLNANIMAFKVSENPHFHKENPYEVVGIMHNEYLKKIIALGTPTQTEVYEFAKKQLNNIQTTTESEALLVSEFQKIYDAQTAHIVNGNSVEEILQPILTTNYGTQAAKKLDIILNESSNIDVIINKIKNLETSIIKNGSLTESEKSTLLTTSSVARHSLKFWDDFDGPKPVSPWRADLRAAGSTSLIAAGVSLFAGPVAPIVWAASVSASGAMASAFSYFD